jgi:hypothetical protein
MKPPKCGCGEEAAVTMNDVWLCLEDFQTGWSSVPERYSRRWTCCEESAMPKSTSKTPEVCCICDLPRQQCLVHKQVPIKWCPPAAAEGVGSRVLELPRFTRVEELAQRLPAARRHRDTMAFAEWLAVDAHLRRTSQSSDTEKQLKPSEPLVSEPPASPKRSRRPRDVDPRSRPIA